MCPPALPRLPLADQTSKGQMGEAEIPISQTEHWSSRIREELGPVSASLARASRQLQAAGPGGQPRLWPPSLVESEMHPGTPCLGSRAKIGQVLGP
ncbi:unnamed protein product [Rangifer tarandus platyrhynchus]|uniref:Uncharacterized protein n=1 Tax=Rangifer tarandus platyrhynchus TaxID=3082113 RepID=A0AC59Y7D8_RANTA